jgi:hypothetical protein
MTYRLLDDCKVIFDGPAQDIQRAIVRQNGNRVTISVPDVSTITLSDGTEVSEENGRTRQIDVIDEVEVKSGKRGELIVTGTSRQLLEAGPEAQAAVSFKVIPGPNCKSC